MTPLLLVGLACAATSPPPAAPPPPLPEAAVPPATPGDPLDAAIDRLRAEHDRGEVDGRDVDGAWAVLAADPAAATTRLLAALDAGGGTPALLDALGALGTPDGLRRLDHALHDGDLAWRLAAAGALTRHPDGAAFLTAALTDADPLAARAAATALAAAPGTCAAARPALAHPDATVRFATFRALAQGGCLTTDDLTRAASDSDPDVRAWAAGRGASPR